MVINIGLFEVVVAILCFLGSTGVFIWRVSKMQTEQNTGIEANKNSIIVVTEKVKKQTSFNIATESDVKVLRERIAHMGSNIDEIKSDIKTLLTRPSPAQ